MADDAVIEVYTLTDLDENKSLGDFHKLTGGEMRIAMVEYNLAFANGSSTTRYIPGQTSFAPIKLARYQSSECTDSYEIFNTASGGKVNYKNMSIIAQDEKKIERVAWHLEYVLITTIGGFTYNAYQENPHTSFNITLQAESIRMEYL